MKAKFTKDGRVSVKLDDQVWQALEQAFRMELSLIKVITRCYMVLNGGMPGKDRGS